MSNIYIKEPTTNGKVLIRTSMGDIDVELWSKEAPLACRNFVQLCMEGYYDNVIFHRVVHNFIVQGGDPSGTGKEGDSIYGKPFKDEFHSRLRFVRRGLVAMANAGANDNGSQFFFTLGACNDLNKKHTIFGKVTGDTVYNLVSLGDVETTEDERPINPPFIKWTKVLANPFDDIIPRTNNQKGSKSEKKKPKRQVKATKDFKLLSFGDEAAEEEQENMQFDTHRPVKGKSSHDVLHDPTLSSKTFVDEEKEEKGKKRPHEDNLEEKTLDDAEIEAKKKKLQDVKDKLGSKKSKKHSKDKSHSLKSKESSTDEKKSDSTKSKDKDRHHTDKKSDPSKEKGHFKDHHHSDKKLDSLKNKEHSKHDDVPDSLKIKESSKTVDTKSVSSKSKEISSREKPVDSLKIKDQSKNDPQSELITEKTSKNEEKSHSSKSKNKELSQSKKKLESSKSHRSSKDEKSYNPSKGNETTNSSNSPDYLKEIVKDDVQFESLSRETSKHDEKSKNKGLSKPNKSPKGERSFESSKGNDIGHIDNSPEISDSGRSNKISHDQKSSEHSKSQKQNEGKSSSVKDKTDSSNVEKPCSSEGTESPKKDTNSDTSKSEKDLGKQHDFSKQIETDAVTTDAMQALTEKLKKESREIARDILRSKKREKSAAEADKNDENGNENKEETLQADNSLYSQYKQQRKKYKEAAKLTREKSKSESREAQTMALLQTFKAKIDTVRNSTEEVENVHEDDNDEVVGVGWLAHKFENEDELRDAKDMNREVNEDRFDIFDPRNPLNKRRRDAAKKAMAKA